MDISRSASDRGDPRPWLLGYPPDVAWDMPFPEETLLGVLDRSLQRFADFPCMDFYGRRWNYQALGTLVARAAEGFRRLGAGPGTRIGLCLPNTPFAVIAYYAALRIGAVVVNFSPLSVAETLAAQRADSDTTIMVTSDIAPIFDRVHTLLRTGLRHLVVCRLHQALPPARAALFLLAGRRRRARVDFADVRISSFGQLIAHGEASPGQHSRVSPRDLAVLQYTGGTTSTPKGVELTHGNLTANVRQIIAWLPISTDGKERLLHILPLFHVLGMTGNMNTAVAVGAEMVLLPRFNVAETLAALRRTRPTVLIGVPTVFKALLDGGAAGQDLASIRVCFSGGAPLPLEVARAFANASGNALVEGYGLTEASPACFCNPVGPGNRIGTIGLPLPGVTAEIRALDDPGRALPPGERGELCVRGPNVMSRYWNQPQETARAFTPDSNATHAWLRTGDVGIMAEDGYVTLVDRIKDLIICSGFNVYPRNIEEALYRHPAVAAATVTGMPDAYRGESPAAFVQPKPGTNVTPDELRAFLSDKLSAVEMPRLIELRQSLPRTAVGKLSRTELRAEMMARAARAEQARQAPDAA